jgi:cytochrome c-type biogenesis protein CcsB
MLNVEILFFWAAIFTYICAFGLYLIGFISDKKHKVGYVVLLLWLGLIFHTVTGILRWLQGNHPPVTDIYELNLTGTWFTMLLFLLFERIKKVERSIILILIPIVLLILGHGFMSKTEAVPMSPAYQSPWLIVHVIFAWLAFGGYAISAGAAILVLLKEKRLAWKPLDKVPASQVMDIMSYRFVVLGFINHAVMIGSGAIWAKKLWGHYWSWDALETWSLIAFLFYAFYLHVRAFLGWKMKRAAWLALVGLIVVAISFWAVDLFTPSIHPGP